MRSLITITPVAFALVLAACGGGDNQNEVAICDAPDDAWTNLNSESEGFRTNPEPRVDWTEGGCAVNLNFIFHRYGDEHCATENVEFISIGLPIGTPYTGPTAIPPGQDWDPLFFHNTDGAYDWLPTAVVLDELPADAVDTGLRASNDRALHTAPNESELYVMRGDDVLVFVPVSDDEVSCA